VVGEELIRRHETVEGVHEQAAAEPDLAPVPLLEPHVAAVGAVARRQVAIEHLVPEGLTHGERGDLEVVDLG